MDMIEFPSAIRKTYDSIHEDVPHREELICRIYNQKTPEKGYVASGICFANVLGTMAEHTELTHVEYNPFEFLETQGISTITAYGFNFCERKLLKPQEIRKIPISKKDMEKWLHLGKIYKLLPKGRGIDTLLKKGVKITLDSSPTEILGALIYMRHMWREISFIKSVLFLISKTNMDFWQAFVLASYGKVETTAEHTICPERWQNCYDERGARIDKCSINILLLPTLRMVHDDPKKFDRRSVTSCDEWDTDSVFIRASRFKIWVAKDALYEVDLKPLIYSDILRKKGITRTEVIKLVSKILDKKYIL